MKIKLGITLIAAILFASVYVSAAEIRTHSADDITYYGATLHGFIVDADSEISSYGFELWAENDQKNKTQIGTGSYTGDFEAKFIMPDDTKFYYRAYMKDKSSNYYYGEEYSFNTGKRSISQPPEINFNISVETPNKIDFENSPNKFFLNNLIINQPEKLKLIAGNNFDGIDDIMQSGGENIFLNQHFINHYYSDPLLRSTLTIFDGLIYNRGDWINEVTTSNIVCDTLAGAVYNLSDDSLKDTIRSVYSDMGVKRFSGAINNVINSQYTSSDKKSFGYDQGSYQMLNAVSGGAKTAKKAIDSFKKGEQKLVDGIEAYQTYYFDKIAPKYTNASNNFMQISKYLNENYDKLSDDKRAEYLDYYYSYLKEVHTCDQLGFANEQANKWKNKLEYDWFGEKTKNVLDSYGKVLSLTSSTLGTIKAIDQTTRNKEQLEGTFTRLRGTTQSGKLQITLDDYLYKMNHNTGDFIISTAGNIYDVFIKKQIMKTANEEIKNAGLDLVAQTNGLYTAKVTDKALAEANHVLIAADAGGFFADKIFSTKTVLEKSIELKYLWNIENESKEMLRRDLSAYSQNQTEENAEKVMNDLYWIKSLKLREISAANDIYKANGKNWISLADKGLKETADNVEKIFKSQRDALIDASLTENIYTTEPLILKSGESYLCYAFDGTYDGSMVSGGETTLLKNSRARLSGGVEIGSGATLSLMNTSGVIYIPYVKVSSGGNLIINNSRVIIGELTINGTAVLKGNVTVSELTMNSGTAAASDLTVTEAYTHNNGTVNLDNGVLNIWGSMLMKQGTINGGTIELSGSADISGSIISILNAHNNIKASSAKIDVLNICGIQNQILSGTMTVKDLTFKNPTRASVSGTVSVNGVLTNTLTKLTGGKNIQLISGGKIGGTIYNNDLTLNGASVSNVTFEKSLYTKGSSGVSDVLVKNMLFQTGTLNLNGDISVKGDLYNSGTIAGTANTLNLFGDLSGSGKISSLTICSDKRQNITSGITVTDFYNKNKELNVGATVTVTGKVRSEQPMINGKNIQLSASGYFGDDIYIGDITLNGLSGNLPKTFSGNIYAGGTTLNISESSAINGKLLLSETTLNITNATLTINGTYSGNAAVTLTNSSLVLNGIASPAGTIVLNNSVLNANKVITNSASVSLNDGSTANIKADMTNSGKITGGGVLNLNGDLVNSGTLNINTLNIDTKNRTLSFSGNALNLVDLNISGRGALNLSSDINVSGRVSNSGTAVNENKIILPPDENAPLKSLTSSNGYTLNGKTVIVNGNCSISGGAVSLTNGAKLIVNKAFIASGTTFNIDETSEIIIKRYSKISSFSDIVNNGKIIFGGDVSLTSTKLSGNGEYILLGDLYLSSASVNKPNVFTISGGTPQKLCGGTMNFNNLNLANTSKSGIAFGSDANYIGELTNDNTKISGTITKTEE